MTTTKFFLRFALFALMATCILGLTSCGGNGPDDPNDPDKPGVVDELGVSLTEIHFTNGQDASLLVVRTQHRWTASASAAWVKLSATSGNGNTGFLVAADANPGAQRTATLTISADGKTVQLPVLQEGAGS